VISHKARSLKDLDLNIKSPIDASFFSDSESKLHLFKKDIVYEIRLNSESLMNGVLKSISSKRYDIKDFFHNNMTFGCKPVSNTEYLITGTENIGSDSTSTDSILDADDNISFIGLLFATLLIIVCIIIWIAFIFWVCSSEDTEKGKKLPNYSEYKIQNWNQSVDEEPKQVNQNPTQPNNKSLERTNESLESRKQFDLQKFDKKNKYKL
jgi:hypothetical protein